MINVDLTREELNMLITAYIALLAGSGLSGASVHEMKECSNRIDALETLLK